MSKFFSTIASVSLVVSLAASLGFMVLACGKDDKNKKEDTSTGNVLSFATDVAPVVKTNCTDAGCHGANNLGKAVATGEDVASYEDNETKFKADATKIIEQLNAGLMPQGKTISAADKKILIDFAQQ